MIIKKILDLFNNNEELSLLEAIQEYSNKNNIDIEEILDIIEDDTIFKELLYKDLVYRKYIVTDEVDHLSLWNGNATI